MCFEIKIVVIKWYIEIYNKNRGKSEDRNDKGKKINRNQEIQQSSTKSVKLGNTIKKSLVTMSFVEEEKKKDDKAKNILNVV